MGPMGPPYPWSSRRPGPGDKSQPQTPQVTRASPCPPGTKASLLGSASQIQQLVPWENEVPAASSTLMQMWPDPSSPASAGTESHILKNNTFSFLNLQQEAVSLSDSHRYTQRSLERESLLF